MSTVIINDWTMVGLGEIADIKTGKLDSNRAEEKGRYPFFTCAPNPLRINDYAFDIEAILLAGNNADGIFHLNYYNGKFNAYQRTYVITAKNSNQLDLSYLFYALQLSLNLMKSFSQGTSTKFLTMKILFDLEISLPPIEVQKAISKTLSGLDAKIKTNQQMNRTLEAVGKALFKRWFVDFEFPNQEGKPYKSTGGKMVYSEELQKEIPIEWKVGCIDDVANVIGGGTPSTKVPAYFTTDGIPWLTPKDLSGFEGKFITKGATDLTADGLKNSSAKLLPKGTVLFSSRAPIGFMAIALNNISTNQGFKSLVPKENMKSEYLYQFVKMITPYIQSISSGSTFGEVTGRTMKQIKIIVPELNLLQKFEGFMQPINFKIVNNSSNSKALKEIRDLQLPKLMSGKIRVPINKEILEAT